MYQFDLIFYFPGITEYIFLHLDSQNFLGRFVGLLLVWGGGGGV